MLVQQKFEHLFSVIAVLLKYFFIQLQQNKYNNTRIAFKIS
jgi:hypothetical protein